MSEFLNKSKFELVLGSASPRRKELLGHLGLPFEIITADIDENLLADGPFKLVSELSRLKGEAVLNKCGHMANPLVISADTTVALGQVIYNKPKDLSDAERILRELSGKTHEVYTGVSLTSKQFQKHFVVTSKVTFDRISDSLMKSYLKTGESLDKAGAYGIQGASLSFISKVEGSYSNVVGLPLSDLVSELKHYFPL